MSSNGFTSTLLDKHLSKLAQRKARFAAAHPELGPMELRRSYWEAACRRQHISESRRQHISECKEVDALIRLVKESQPFWE